MSERFDELTRNVANLRDLFEQGGDRRSLGSRAAAMGLGLLGIRQLSGEAKEPPESASIEAKGDRPGKYSQREGIESWRVQRRPSGYEVRFRHRDRKLSGKATVTYADSSDNGTFVLDRDRGQVRLSFSGGRRGRFAFTDERGRSSTGVADRKRGRWNIASESVLK